MKDAIIIHCSATRAEQDITAADIESWHRARGFWTIGYHYVIRLDGTIEPGRDVTLDGAHCMGWNKRAIGICYVGGLDKDGRPADTRTDAQRTALIRLVKALRLVFPGVKQVLGHRDTSPDLNGDGVISYVMFKGQEGNAEAEARTQFGVEDANAVLTAAGKPELAYYNASATDKYLVDQGGKWSAQAANDYMATILPEYSEANGNMVELIICNNDGMAEGAVSALQGAGYNTGDGKTIPVFGVDATDSAKQLINEGKMTGTIKQDAEGMASTIVNLVSSVKNGGNLMDNTSSFNVDEGVAKIRVPYATYTGE